MSAHDCCPMPLATQAPADAGLVPILARSRAVAIVGASPHPEKTSYQVIQWLIAHTPFELYLVNPVAAAADADLAGHGFYASLAEVPVTPDIVVAFRRSEDIPPVAQDAIDANAAVLWMQLGITHDDAAAQASAAGLEVIQNRCIKVEYARLSSRIEAAGN